MACPGCLPADCPCVAVVVTETLAEVRGHISAMYAALVVSLSSEDHGQSMLGYARARVARPGSAARWEGLAVAIDTADGVPDPVVLVVDGDDGSDDAQLRIAVDRRNLPAVFHIDAKGRRIHWETMDGSFGGTAAPEPSPAVDEWTEPEIEMVDGDWIEPELDGGIVEGLSVSSAPVAGEE